MATISYRRHVGLLALWLSATAAFGQSQPWAVQWNQHAFSAQAGRDYLGITNFIPGTNVSFSHPSALVYKINLSGGSPMPPGSGVWWTDGTNIWWTNTIPGQAYIGDGVGPHINLYTDGRGNFESNLTTKAALSSLTLGVSSNVVVGGASNVFAVTVAASSSNTNKVVINAGSANTLVVTNGRVLVNTPSLGTENFYVNGNAKVSSSLAVGGNIVGSIDVYAGPGFKFAWNGRSSMYSGADGDMRVTKNDGTTLLLSVTNGNVTVPGYLTASNGLYYFIAQTNSSVTTNAWQPLHTFAALMGYVTNTINGGANTYAIVTNYSTVRTNLMNCSQTAGTITNTIAGFYYVAIHMSMKAVDAGAIVEGDLLLNGVERDEVSFQTQFDPGTPRYKGASAFGILYIPANTQITFQVKSSGANGIEIRRQQMIVMPP